MASCERCDGEVTAKNAAGHYRKKCVACIQAIADAEPTHREQCGKDDCLICDSP